MSDFKASLPVRTEADADERLQSKIVDYSTVSQGMTVDTDNNAHVEVHGNRADDAADVALVLSEQGRVNPDGVYEADDNSKPAHTGVIGHVRAASPADSDLTERITSVQGATETTVHALDVSLHHHDGDEIDAANPLSVQVENDINVDADMDGVYNVSTNADPDNAGLIAHVRNTTPGDAHQTFRPTGIQGTDDDTVHALDIALHDHNGDEIDAANPLAVSVVAGAAGTVITDYNTAAAIAKDASTTHTYTVTAGKTLTLSKITASGSGRMKVEVKMGASGSEVTKFVFFTSVADHNLQYEFGEPIQVAATQNVLLVITNRDFQAQDVYSTIEGSEI